MESSPGNEGSTEHPTSIPLFTPGRFEFFSDRSSKSDPLSVAGTFHLAGEGKKLRKNHPQRIKSLEERAAEFRDYQRKAKKKIRDFKAKLAAETDARRIATYTRALQNAESRVANAQYNSDETNRMLQEVITESFPKVTLLQKAVLPKNQQSGQHRK
jgi:hypothetical protein